MKRWQQLIACYAALCVVLAGVVGRSPLLHVYLEHGGISAPHTHDGAGGAANFVHTHVHPHPHPHDVAELPKQSKPLFSARPILPHGEKPLTLFGLEPQDIYRAIGRAMKFAMDHLPAPANEGQNHTHHTLSQLLLSGAVEGALEITPLVCAPERFAFFAPLSKIHVVVAEWNASTATRGPPVCC
jgi:hypothetical protein